REQRLDAVEIAMVDRNEEVLAELACRTYRVIGCASASGVLLLAGLAMRSRRRQDKCSPAQARERQCGVESIRTHGSSQNENGMKGNFFAVSERSSHRGTPTPVALPQIGRNRKARRLAMFCRLFERVGQLDQRRLAPGGTDERDSDRQPENEPR